MKTVQNYINNYGLSTLLVLVVILFVVTFLYY